MMRVAVVGAGMGGLAAALGLARAGVEVQVFERSPVLGELGAGITMSPNSVRVLDWLGVDVRPIGFVPGTQWMQHWQTGEVLREYSRGDDFAAKHGGAGYYHVHRADLHGAMLAALEAAAPGSMRLGAELVAADPDGTMRFADGSRADADVVIGADGVKSGVRAALWPADKPVFTGQVAWRGLVAREALPGEYQDLPPGIHLGPQRLFMRYPVRGGAIINYAAFVEMEGWEEEGWTIPSTIPELLGHFEGWDPLVRAIIGTTTQGQLFKWALHAREPLESWQRGRVTLLGDAAHGMLPFMGQGAASALEDAAILVRCLLAMPVPAALARYEEIRLPKATMVQTQSRLLGLQHQGKDPRTLGKGGVKNEEELGLFDYDAVTDPI